ncbi:MAG: hypothetical protein ACNA8W_26155 [Bradymonadaceae bacterium]
MKTANPLLFFTLLVVGMALPALAFSETPSFSGTYELDKEAGDDMLEAFEPALLEMGLVKRTLARQYMRRNVKPDEQLRIEQKETTVSIQSGDRPPIIAPLSGEETKYTKFDGSVARVRTRIIDDVLELRAVEPAGGYTTRYSLSPDGRRLTMRVNLSYEQLPKPVSYMLVYVRK